MWDIAQSSQRLGTSISLHGHYPVTSILSRIAECNAIHVYSKASLIVFHGTYSLVIVYRIVACLPAEVQDLIVLIQACR